jgi:hypothetical protein
MEKILHIHVKEKYWQQVKDKLKNKEYRLIKPYWIKRLKKDYDLICYWCAYTPKKLIFKYNGYVRTVIKHEEFGDKPVNVFAIDLTKPHEVSLLSSHD